MGWPRNHVQERMLMEVHREWLAGYYRQCVGRYKCTQSSYDYWVNLKWWQFLIWEVVIIILGCCFFGLAVGCCIRCWNGRNNNNNNRRYRRAPNPGNNQQNAQR